MAAIRILEYQKLIKEIDSLLQQPKIHDNAFHDNAFHDIENQTNDAGEALMNEFIAFENNGKTPEENKGQKKVLDLKRELQVTIEKKLGAMKAKRGLEAIESQKRSAKNVRFQNQPAGSSRDGSPPLSLEKMKEVQDQVDKKLKSPEGISIPSLQKLHAYLQTIQPKLKLEAAKSIKPDKLRAKDEILKDIAAKIDNEFKRQSEKQLESKSEEQRPHKKQRPNPKPSADVIDLTGEAPKEDPNREDVAMALMALTKAGAKRTKETKDRQAMPPPPPRTPKRPKL